MAGPAVSLQSLAAILTKTIDPKPLTYRGVLMRSTLETDFARHLDQMGAEWIYEPRIYGVKGSGYLPDFQIIRHGPACYVEVKPTTAEVPLARERMEVIWKSEPEAVLLVSCAEGCTFWAGIKGEPWVSFTELWKHA
jgi:predicted nuclease of restriction endonuclease-like RecB superfamily